MYYSMKLNKKTEEKITYDYGPSMEELDGVLEIDRRTMIPTIVKKSEKTIMRFTTLGKLIVSISKGKIPEKYSFAS